MELAKVELDATAPMRLGLALNFAVFCYEINGRHHFACHVLKTALGDSLSDIGSLSEETLQKSTFVMQLLRENLALWQDSEYSSEIDAASSHDDRDSVAE